MEHVLEIYDSEEFSISYLSGGFQHSLYIGSTQAEQVAYLVKKNKSYKIFKGVDKKSLTEFSKALKDFNIESKVLKWRD